MTVEWVRRAHSRIPLTGQEERVRGVLVELGLSFEVHPVFELGGAGRVVLDFLVFSGGGVVVECTFCSKGRGSVLSEVRRRCVFVDYRFRLLKERFPSLVCGMLVEAPREDAFRLESVVRGVLGSGDFVAVTLVGLREALRELRS